MSDRDVPTLRCSSAALMQRLLGPMERVLQIACADLGVEPVVRLGRREGPSAATAEPARVREAAAQGQASPRGSLPAASGADSSRGPVVAAPQLDTSAREALGAPPRPDTLARDALDAPPRPDTRARDALDAPPRPDTRARDALGAPPRPAASARDALDAPPRPDTLARDALDAPPRPHAPAREPLVAVPPRHARSHEPFSAAPAPAVAEPWHPEVLTAGAAARSVTDRVRLRPRPPLDASDGGRSPASERSSPPASPRGRADATGVVRIRARPAVERAALSTSATSPSPAAPAGIDHAVPSHTTPAGDAATRVLPTSEPLTHATASVSSWTSARVLVPVADVPTEPARREHAAWSDAPSSPAPPSLAPASLAPRTETPRSPAMGLASLASREPTLVDAPTTARPFAASRGGPAPRFVSLDARPTSLDAPPGPPLGLDEDALAAVIAAAARRHGIDT